MRLKPARKLAATAAVALAASAIATVAPATAASAALNYNCEVPILGPKTFSVVVDTDAPTTVAPGSTVGALNTTADVTVPADMGDAIRGILGATSLDGTSDTDSVVNGVAQTKTLTIAKTAIPASGPVTVRAAGAFDGFVAGAEGTTHTIAAGKFTAHMNLYKADGTSAGNFDIPCVAAAGQDLTVDTVKATAAEAPPAKADSKTTVKAKFTKKKKTITANVTVKGTDGAAGTGKVKVTLKKGKKKVKTIQAKLNAKGAAKAVFKKINKKGKYTVEVEYKGSATQNASKAKATVKVK